MVNMGTSDQEQSRNSWINKDEPTDVSSLAPYKDGYEDILEGRRQFSDLKYALHKRSNIPVYKYNKVRTAEQIKEHVLASDRVNYAIEKVSRETNLSRDAVLKEAKSILDEMAHTLNLGAVRFFAFFLVKVFKSLFNRIYVNAEGIEKLRKLIHEYPVLLMPTHRSYMDFLLVSYVCFNYELPLPVIAAAMDFKGMKFFGWLLRNCGAFYIRRSFVSDDLYWAVFTEYVQTQLRNSDAPIEFFVEGTRSRTAKSYVPKIGMMSASLESYFKAELPDIMIVPISISYDRILEESLYAYELIGIPKPKESASGLLKARHILSEDFGCVHIHIGDSTSIRQFSDGKIDRVYHALEPRYINNLTSAEAELTKYLAYRIVREQQKHMVISPWALTATVLMQNTEGIPLKQLVKEVEWLKRQAYNLGTYVDWPGNAFPETVIRHFLGIHGNIVCVSDTDLIELRLVKPAHVDKPVENDVILNAATNLILGSYRNQLLHVFVRVAMVALTVNGCEQDVMTMDEMYRRYSYLEQLFCKDFVFQSGETRKDFEQCVLALSHSGGLVIQDDIVQIKKSINKHTTFLSQMFEPFLFGYWVLCQHLLSLASDVNGRPLPKKPKEIAREAQKVALRLLQENITKHYEIVSLDLLGNGLAALVDLGTMYKDKRNEEPWLSPNHVLVSRVAHEIGKYIELPAMSIANSIIRSKTVVVSAKI